MGRFWLRSIAAHPALAKNAAGEKFEANHENGHSETRALLPVITDLTAFSTSAPGVLDQK